MGESFRINHDDIKNIAHKINATEDFVEQSYRGVAGYIPEDFTTKENYIAFVTDAVWKNKTDCILNTLNKLSALTNKSGEELFNALGMEKIEREYLSTYYHNTVSVAVKLIEEMTGLVQEITSYITENRLPYCFGSEIKDCVEEEAFRQRKEIVHPIIDKTNGLDFEQMENDPKNKYFLDRLIDIQDKYKGWILGEGLESLKNIKNVSVPGEIEELRSSMHFILALNHKDDPLTNMRRLFLQTNEVKQDIIKHIGKKWFFIK